jgi:carbon-monoxide dehydrogenase medium subunit
MPRVSYTAPTTIDDAVKALAASAGLAKVLSGGTDLLVQLKSGRARPELIVDTKRIPGMIGIREEGDKFVIGAATPGVMISADERLVKAFPGIVEGVDLIGSTQIQGRASIAGNLCNGSPAADSVPPVIAARGTAVIAGPNGRREVPVESIVTGPGQTSLQKGEGGTCTDARIVLGAVAPTQLIVDEAAQALIGHKLDDATLQRLDSAARAACRPISDKRGTIEYRIKVAGVLARRAAAIAFERAAARA